jgi:hypothetical protein
MTYNPDRKSNARKRQERVKLLAYHEADRWWLEEEAGMLTKDTLKRLQLYRIEKQRGKIK